MAVIGWVITKDHVWKEGDDKKNIPIKSREGCIGVVNGTKEEVIALTNDPETRQHFKIYDDDGNLNFEGFATLETEFQPLNWAMADVGATEIRYRNKETGKYETL